MDENLTNWRINEHYASKIRSFVLKKYNDETHEEKQRLQAILFTLLIYFFTVSMTEKEYKEYAGKIHEGVIEFINENLKD